MKKSMVVLYLALLVLVRPAWAQDTSSVDVSPHKIRFITTDDNVKLEVLDWGGTGRPLIFLAGLGATAHVYDQFALQFVGKYHVYGITRRGFGASDKPTPTVENYSADRLGEDVAAVIDGLKLDKPVLVGWSLAGEELSDVAVRGPEKIGGVIYLDAGFAYAFYSPGNPIPPGRNLAIDVNDMNRKVQQVAAAGTTPRQMAAVLNDLIQTNLPQLKADLLSTQQMVEKLPQPPSATPPRVATLERRIEKAVQVGAEKFTDIKVPILAIFAVPKTIPEKAPASMRATIQLLNAAEVVQAKTFQAGNPSARVVLIPNSQHDVFKSNPSEVAREMNAFLEQLP